MGVTETPKPPTRVAPHKAFLHGDIYLDSSSLNPARLLTRKGAFAKLPENEQPTVTPSNRSLERTNTMADQVTLFDLPANDGKAWSHNPWKTRAVLNFKSIPYKTQWVEYPDIKPLFSSLGIPPNDPSVNSVQYTIPAVQLPDGRYVMDSHKIAPELEALKPLPSLRLHGGYVERTLQVVGKVRDPLVPAIVPNVPAKLNKGSLDYFEETRAKRFGMPLAELAKSDRAGEAAWAAAQEGLEALKDLLSENGAGPYVEGATPGYADMIIAGFLEFARRIAPAVFERITGYGESVKNHYEATKPWLERNDH